MLKNAGDIGLALTVIPVFSAPHHIGVRRYLQLCWQRMLIRPQGCCAKKRLKIANLGCARSCKSASPATAPTPSEQNNMRKIIAWIGVRAALRCPKTMAHGDSPEPTCPNCPGTYISADELSSYLKKAIAQGRTDQQVRDVDIGKARRRHCNLCTEVARCTLAVFGCRARSGQRSIPCHRRLGDARTRSRSHRQSDAQPMIRSCSLSTGRATMPHQFATE